MDTSDIYYSDNSQLIDENNSEWIGNTVLIENHDITWQEDGPEITVDYSETANKSLAETDEYLTATENDETTTETSQYFSILESNCDDIQPYSSPADNRKFFVKVAINKEEVILPDITKLETEDEYVEPEESIRNETTDDQVILYRMEDSDELYAIQIADDGNGNFQKYKYRVRQNDDGQLEAIPGSIEIQSADQNDIQEQHNDSEIEDLQPKDQKPNSETLALINQHVTEGDESSEIENNYYINNVHHLNNINPDDYLIQNAYEQDTEEEYQTVDGVHITGDSESNSQSENIETTEFINSGSIYPPTENSESEYEIEELDEAFQDENINDIYDEHSNNDNPQILQHKTNIDNFNVNSDSDKEFKHIADNRNVTIFKDDKHLSYLVVKAKEKENVSIIRASNFNSSNLRSILKSNFPTNKIICSTPNTDEKENSLNIPSICLSNKSLEPKPVKEVVTTNNILLKSARQPRKQTIKPVDRAGSEIIVQPLVYTVSEDNVITSTSVKKKRVIQEVLQVSDESDPEFTLKPKKKKLKKTKQSKRGRPKNIEITIIDSDDEEDVDQESDGSVIEVLTDEETSDTEQISENNNEQSNEKSDADENEKEIQEEVKSKDSSNNKNESVEENKEPEKDVSKEPLRKSIGNNKKNKCLYCPKTFPRLITLKKHMNIHSNRRSLRSRRNIEENNKESEEKSENVNIENSKVNESKPRSFNCVKCKLKFLTETQFKRHQTIHLPKISTMKKQISSIKKPKKQILISQKHLRSQNKQPETNLRSQRLLPIRKPVVNDNKTKEIFKCEYCSQIFGTRTLLIVHRNSHKTFPCPNCRTTFTAKLLLDDHLRKNCVKVTPKKIKPKSPVKKFASKRINSKCEICQQVFPTLKSLQIHKNVTHKRLAKAIDTTKTVKTKGAHGGVPLSLKMQQALNKLKTKS